MSNKSNTTSYTIKTTISKKDLVFSDGTSSVRSLKKLINQGYHAGLLKQYNGLSDSYIKKHDGVYYKYAGQSYRKCRLKQTVNDIYIQLGRFNSETLQVIGKIPHKYIDFFQMALKHCSSYMCKATILGGTKKVTKNGESITYQSGEYGVELEITFYFKAELERYGFLLPKEVPNFNLLEIKDYVSLDLELISGEYLFTEIIEIGAIKYKDGKEVARFQKYVKPRQRIPYVIRKITHIDDELVKDASPIEVVLPELLKFIEDLPILGHDVANNDMRIIRKEMYRQNIGFLSNQPIDTLKLSRQLYKLDHYRLENIKEYLKLDFRSHEAINDCLVSNRIFEDYKEFKAKEKE